MRTEYGKFLVITNINDTEAAFIRVKELGFHYCQLLYKPKEYTEEAAKIILDASKKYNVPIVSMFAGYNDYHYPTSRSDSFKTSGINSKKYGKARIAYIKSAAAFAKSIGIEDVLIHAGFIANNPCSSEYKYMKECLTDFAVYCKNIGVNVLLETGCESPITMLRIIEEIGLGNIYANLDTANPILYGFGNPVDAVYTLKHHIKSLHIKDGFPPVDPEKLGVQTPVGEGFVDFVRVFAELEKIGFDGPIIIEREISGEKQEEDLKNSIKYLDTEIFGR